MAGLFDHKYPTENLHELDLSWVICEIQKFRATLKEWEQIIDEIRQGLAKIDELDSRVNALESLTSKLNDAYVAIDRLSADNVKIWNEIEKILKRLKDIENELYDISGLFTGYVDHKITAEKIARINADFELDVKIRNTASELQQQIDYILCRIEQLLPVDVYNRVAGRRLSFDDNNFNVYEDLRYFGITNAQLSEFGRSNEFIASIALNNRDYALNAKKRLKLHYIFSPVTGLKRSVANVISDVVALIGAGADNSALYAKMAEDSATNEDLGNYYSSNLERYAATV